MQHCGGWKLKCHCKLMVSNSLVLPLRSASSLDSPPGPPRCLHYCATAVWCTRSCRGLCRVSPQLASLMSLQPQSSSSQHTVLGLFSHDFRHCTRSQNHPFKSLKYLHFFTADEMCAKLLGYTHFVPLSEAHVATPWCLIKCQIQSYNPGCKQWLLA